MSDKKQTTIPIKALTDDVAGKTGLTKDTARAVIDALVTSINENTTAGARVAIPGLGTFRVAHRPERMGRNPKTGETKMLAASNKLAFKPIKPAKRPADQ